MKKRELTELANFEHLSENIDAKKIANYGYDLENSKWRRMAVAVGGELKTTTEQPNAAYTYDNDGNLTQKIETYTNKTVTTTLTWVGGKLTNKEIMES